MNEKSERSVHYRKRVHNPDHSPAASNQDLEKMQKIYKRLQRKKKAESLDPESYVKQIVHLSRASSHQKTRISISKQFDGVSSPKENLRGLPNKLIQEQEDDGLETIRTAFSNIPEEKSVAMQETERQGENSYQNDKTTAPIMVSQNLHTLSKKKKVAFMQTSSVGAMSQKDSNIDSQEIDNNQPKYFYFRGLLKKLNVENEPDQVQLDDHCVQEHVDDGEQLQIAKQTIQQFIKVNKLKNKTTKNTNIKIFGLTPEEFIAIQAPKQKKDKDGLFQVEDDMSISIDQLDDGIRVKRRWGEKVKSQEIQRKKRNSRSYYETQVDIQKKMASQILGAVQKQNQKSNCRKWYEQKVKSFKEFIEDREQLGFSTLFVISKYNLAYRFFKMVVTLCCLISSYVYAYISAFRLHKDLDENILFSQYFFESIFLVHMILQFFLEYCPESTNIPVTDLKKIAMHYLHGEFKTDLIALIPFQILQLKNNRQYLFLLIKLIRLEKGIRLFNVNKIISYFQNLNFEYIQKMVDSNDDTANDKYLDNTKITLMLMLQNSLKTLKLVIIITNISYFLGIIWYVYCEAEKDFFYDVYIDYNIEEEYEFFQDHFGLGDNERPYSISIILTYYAFTSLSTVGFGDFHPRSNAERIFCALILLFGVAIFSYIMGNFIDILASFQTLMAGLDDGDNLSRFFGILKKFNDNQIIDETLQKDIEQHFNYKWHNDKNQAFLSEKDLSLFEQLPDEVQVCLLKDFMYSDFLDAFSKTFTFKKKLAISLHQHQYYTWFDHEYINFMVGVLKSLEPRFERKNTIIINELDEQNELLFYYNGTYSIGYEINRVKRFVLRFKDTSVIGAYQCTFNKRSIFVYKTLTPCLGYFIRKLGWLRILQENNNIADIVKDSVSYDFKINIKARVLKEKQKDLKKWHSRADYEEILSIAKKKDTAPSAAVESDDEDNLKLEQNTKKFLGYMNATIGSQAEMPDKTDKLEYHQEAFVKKIERFGQNQAKFVELYDDLYKKYIEVCKENYQLKKQKK